MPAKPKKIEGKERHKPPVVVLLVDQPFAAELPAQDEPERTEKEKRQRKSRCKLRAGYQQSVSRFLWSRQTLHWPRAYQISVRSECGFL